MLDLIAGARLVITDSGGLQEETTALGIPCLTVRENTERPVTVTEGTNRLAPSPEDFEQLAREARPNGNAGGRRAGTARLRSESPSLSLRARMRAMGMVAQGLEPRTSGM